MLKLKQLVSVLFLRSQPLTRKTGESLATRDDISMGHTESGAYDVIGITSLQKMTFVPTEPL